MGLKQRVPLLRWSFWRMVAASGNITKTGQIGDGREAAAVDYVLAKARKGDVADVLDTLDRFAYEESFLINVGDEKGKLLDAAVRRACPKLALELGTYCGYGALRIAAAAPTAKVYSVELAEANADNARRIWVYAGVADRVTCVVGTIGDGGRTLDALAGHEADVLLCSHDGDFLPQVEALLKADRKVEVLALREYANAQFTALGIRIHDLEYDVGAFNVTLPRVRIIPLDEFDPEQFLR